VWDVFVHDLESHKTFRVSVSSTGEEGDAESSSPSLSGDGNLVAFSSRATNLVPGDVAFPGDTNYEDIFVHDMMTGKTIRLTTAPDGKRANGDSTRPAISSNGRVVAFISTAPNLVAGDSNGYPDAFVFQFTSPWP
jgi:Tol biopolymer transport system component